MQPAQHPANILHADCIKSRRFPSKMQKRNNFLNKFLSIPWLQIEIFDKLSSSRIKIGCLSLKKAFFSIK